MRTRSMAALAIAFALTGCQGVQHTTPSGRPEVTINAPANDVKTALVGTLANFGYSMSKDTAFQIVMQKESGNVMANVLMGSQYDPTVDVRLTATFLDMSGTTRVTTDLGIVRNGGSAFEATTSVNNSQDSIGVQSLLNDIKTGLESGQTVSQVVASASQRNIAERAGNKQPGAKPSAPPPA